MSTTTDNIVEFKIVCPLCGKTEIIKIPKSELESSPAGIYRIPVEHSDPEPHVLVLDLDPSGFVRGAYLIKKYISADVGFSVRDLILSLGTVSFAYLLAWRIAGYQVVLGSTELESRVARILETLFEDKPRATMEMRITRIPEPPFNVEVLEKLVSRGLQRIHSDKALLSYLKNEVNRYRSALIRIQSELRNHKRISFKELKSLFDNDLTEEELRFIISILISIEPKYKKIIDMPEVRIAELF